MVREDRKKLFVHSQAFLIVVTALALVVAVGLFLWHNARTGQSNNTLPTAVTQQINSFKPYYLKSSYSTDFKLQSNSVKYEYGVLVFSLKNSIGKSLSVTEEATPNQYDPSALQTTSQFNTEYGQAYITDSTDRTTGTLFTSDRTWIIINAASPVGSDFMKQFIEALVPVP